MEMACTGSAAVAMATGSAGVPGCTVALLASV